MMFCHCFLENHKIKKVELAVCVSSKVPSTLVGDPGRFRQIVTNLVGNSIKFTDKGHIFVTVHLVEEVSETEADRDTISSLSGLPVVDGMRSWSGFRNFNQETSTSSSSSFSSDQVNIIVLVEDTGQGIPLEAQSRVFNPFMQVGPLNHTNTRRHGYWFKHKQVPGPPHERRNRFGKHAADWIHFYFYSRFHQRL